MVLLVASNYHLITIKKNENQLLQFENVSNQSKQNILLLGDSFAAYGVSNSKNIGLLNFAYPGDQFCDMYFKLKSVSPPEYLILNTDPHLFLKDAESVSIKYQRKVENQNWWEELVPIINANYRYEYGKYLANNIYRLLGSGEWNKKSIYFDDDWNLKRANQYNWKNLQTKNAIYCFSKINLAIRVQ